MNCIDRHVFLGLFYEESEKRKKVLCKYTSFIVRLRSEIKNQNKLALNKEADLASRINKI